MSTIVSLEIAKLLKVAGYSEPTQYYYQDKDLPFSKRGLKSTKNTELMNHNASDSFIYSAPSMEEAEKFFSSLNPCKGIPLPPSDMMSNGVNPMNRPADSHVRYVTNWENDPTEEAEIWVREYCEIHYKNLEMRILSSLRNRSQIEIIDSIRSGCVAVVIKPHIIDRDQIVKLLSTISKGIYGYVFGTDIEEFIFLKANPHEAAKEFVEACRGKWDDDPYNPRNGLTAVLLRAKCYFVGHGDEKYEVKSYNGWINRDFEIVKIS